MKKLDPYLRYITITNYLPNRDFVKAYDCRFFFVLSGEGELITEDGAFTLSENTLAYYPSGVSYFLKSSVESPLSFVTVNFDFTRSYPEYAATLRPVKSCDFLPNYERSTQTQIGEKRFSSAFVLEHAFFLRNDFVSLASLFGKGEIYTEELCSALLKYIILKISNHFYTISKENKIVRQVMDFIENKYSEKLDNNIIASHFGYHPYYLSSLFKIHFGKTLHTYISEIRLKFGVDMLLHTDMPIGEIAAKCGFQNANHFSVKFKKQYGESPLAWRKQNSVI